MSGSGLHGNDNRSLVYHCYILISDNNKKNVFEDSFMMRRCCTIDEANWLTSSEIFVTHAEPGQASHLGNLSEERRAAQVLGGESVPARIFEALTLNCEAVPKPLLKSASDQVAGLIVISLLLFGMISTKRLSKKSRNMLFLSITIQNGE